MGKRCKEKDDESDDKIKLGTERDERERGTKEGVDNVRNEKCERDAGKRKCK